MPDQPRVVIAGAGFGGLWALRALARAAVDVVLVDRMNYHTFLPLLYQVAAAELEPEEIAFPVRGIVRQYPRVRFIMGEVEAIDCQARTVTGPGFVIPYDYLVLGIGSSSHFFGVPGAEDHAFRLKTLEDAILLRNHILQCVERAAHERDPVRRRRLLTFVIVGGGPTGVEFAGSLAELVRGAFVRDYRGLDVRDMHIILLEAAENVLPGFPDRLRSYAGARLQRMGVEVRLRAPVSHVTETAVYVHDGVLLPTETVVWTAGVRGAPAVQAWGLPVARNGRVEVLPTLRAAGCSDVYAVGDVAYVEDSGRPLPMTAPVAIQQGAWAGRNIIRQMRGQPPVPFRYRDRGTMVTIGRNAAVADVWGRTFTGFPAWVLWLSVHLANLIGFRNRLFVLINWAWDYFFYDRAVRLILPLGKPAQAPDRHPMSASGGASH